MPTLLLGPSEWDDGPHTPVPAWVQELLEGHAGELASREPSPLQVRRAFAAYLQAQGHPVVIMEDWKGEPDRVQMRLFRRIVAESRISRFLLYWPRGGRLLGLTAEVDYLTNRILDRSLDPGAVLLLPEEGVVREDDEGRIVMAEKAHRTRYHGDLYELGCPYQVWRTYEELRLLLRCEVAD